MALTDGLIEYWKLDGNSNGIFGYNGTDTNITYSAANGKLIQGAGCNGSSSNIDVGTTSTFSFIQNTAIFTISFWAKTNNYTLAQQRIIGNTVTSSEKGFYILQSSTGNITLQVFIGDSNPNTLVNYTGTSYFTDNNWRFVTVVCNKTANSVQWYRDGVSFGSSGTVGTTTTGSSNRTLKIGVINGAALANYYNGALDEVGIWNRALSADEVKDLYLNGNGSQYPFRDKGFFMM